MASKVDICSMAMYLIGGNSVADLDDPQTEEERACRLFWDPCVREVLEAHDWKFARAYKVLDGTLALTTSPSDEYSYAYQFPTDLLVLRYLWDTDSKCRVTDEYEVHGRLILTNLETVNIVYTKDDKNVGTYPAFFVTALMYLMASRLSSKLAEWGGRSTETYRLYKENLAKAIDRDCSQNQYEKDAAGDSWLNAGGYDSSGESSANEEIVYIES